ncbi:gustatory receptor 64b [Cochliomyia hominivorax]
MLKYENFISLSVLFISQIFALMPVKNIYHHNHSKMKYLWFSLPTCYAVVIMVLNVSEFCLVLKYIFKNGLSFHISGTISLFLVCLLEHVFFWRLAIKWPKLILRWRQVEQLFVKAPYQLYANFNMKLKIYIWYLLIMLGSLAEHCILVYNSFHKSNLERTQCKLNISYWESLYVRERPHLQNVIPFQYWLLPLLEWINLTLAYPRSFTDAFVVIISIGLASRFRQIHLRIESVRGKAMPSIFWKETREHFLVLKRLMRIINMEISPIILLGLANNMYFICFQLFNSFNNIGVDWVAVAGFWFSLIFNIIRTIVTLYLATSVDEYTKKIISCLRDIPSKSWCMETQRFNEQLAVDLTAFTGGGFFFMTRKLILTMASTIITYELMVSDVINQGSIKQITDYCSHYYEEPSYNYKQYS